MSQRLISDVIRADAASTQGTPPLPAAHRPGSTAARTLCHRVYGSFAEAEALHEAWDELAARCGDLFGSFDWGEVWWRHFGRNRQLQIHAVHDERALVAVLPLFAETLRPAGISLRVVRLVGCDHTLTPAGIAIRPEYVEPVLQQVIDWLEERRGWDLLHLGPLQCYMGVADAIAEALAGLAVVGEVIAGRQDNCITVYEIPETYEQYLAGLQGSERRNILRCERNVVADRGVRVAAANSEGEVQQAMRDLVQLHQCLWTGKGKLGQFRDWPDYDRFHEAMAERLGQKRRLVLVTLKVGEQVVGVEYGYHFGTRLHALIRGYCDQPEWRSYSIGRMLHCHMVQQAIARGAHLMDDGRGAFEYKRRLGGELRCERSLTAVRGAGVARLRVWLALRAAWCVHAVYDRLWFDWLRPALRLPTRPLLRSYIRISFLAHLLKRTHLPLRRTCRYRQTLCNQGEPSCPRAGGTATTDKVTR